MSGRARRALHRPGGGPGDRVTLAPEESLHLCKVLRLEAGAEVSVFDGAGREWDGVLSRADPRRAQVVLGTERTDPVEPAVQVAVAQSLCRPERMEWVLQKGCEVGVSRFVLVDGERSEGPRPSPARLERWEKILGEACKQSGRRRVPALAGPSRPPLSLAAAEVGIVLHPGQRPLGGILRERSPAPVVLAVGPAGGFAEDERAAWRDAGWIEASLGPRVLRTETAGVIAAAVVLHVWGDLGNA